ncbi:MAG: PPC domain-containing protein [Planctomycetota bacterium]|nr:PPC domain-containing protein [Planctomycetota bacterium]
MHSAGVDRFVKVMLPYVMLAIVAVSAVPVEAAFPRLSIILPRGVQRGGDRELTFQGDRLADVEEVFFHSNDGFEVKSLTPVDDKSFKAVIHVPESCSLGEHIVQVRAKSGITEYRSFWVGLLPVVDEAEPNGMLEEAQAVEWNTTVHGVVESEDLDIYVVDAKQGDRISVEIEGLRLGSYRFDPHISIIDANKFQLAAADDSPAVLQDGVISVLAPEDGRYYVQVRESSYGGDGNSRYRLHVGNFPRPTSVYPAGGKAGEKLTVSFLGDARGPLEREIEVATEGLGADGDEMLLLASDDAGTCPATLPFRISSLGNVLEAEPNNEIAQATSGDVAMAFNGVIAEAGDVDHFRFGATKGQRLEVTCHARRLRSGLDSVVTVHKLDGGQLAGNDDARGPDSSFRFDVPEDGEYVLRVKDHLDRGSHDFVYRVEMLPPEPSLSLSIPRIDRYSQTRQTIFVPRGNRYAVLINASRRNFGGDLTLDGSQLPDGITMTTPIMKDGQGQVPVVFEAAADAPLGGKLIRFEARQVTADDPEGVNGIRGIFENRADFVLGQPNNAVHYSGRVDKLAVAVIEEVPLQVEIVQPKAPLLQRGTLDLKVRVTRGEGFTGPVTIEFPFRPAGVGANPSIRIEPDQTEAVYQLSANDKAAVGMWPVYAIAAVDVGGTAWVASPMAALEVASAFTNATLARAACEQGEKTQIVCTLEQARPFEGEATARLLGLPPEATAAELTFTKDSAELVFEVTTTDKSPAGNHKSVFVELVTPVEGETSKMSGGSTELQIAAPAPDAPAAPVAQAEPEKPAEKPLSRLEKLRQQARAAAAAY